MEDTQTADAAPARLPDAAARPDGAVPPQTADAAPVRRWPTLDLLRLAAISLVMAVHFPSLGARLPWIAGYQAAGYLGVDLFMIISGWLLGGQVLRECATRGSMDARRFYFKRWMRTLPPYYAMLVLLWASRGGNPLWWLSHFVFAQTYLDTNLYGVSWSLCVEEHFYLVLPLLGILVVRAGRAGPALLGALVVGLEALAIAGRSYTFPSGPEVPFLTHLRMDGLMLGVALAYAAQFMPRTWRALGRAALPLALLGAAGLLVYMPRPQSEYFRFTYSTTIGTWLFFLVFIACVHPASRLSRISFPGLRYLGELTYALYLVHDVIPRSWLGVTMGENPLAAIALRLGLVVGLSVALHHVVERPFLRLRERILRRHARAARPVALA